MREIININSAWGFTKTLTESPSILPTDLETVNLPHTWNATDGQDGGNDYYRGTCRYVKTIKKADLPEADQYYLELNGANSSADVYVNGEHMAHHDGGYSTWRVNITEKMTDETVLVIDVDNAPTSRYIPRWQTSPSTAVCTATSTSLP